MAPGLPQFGEPGEYNEADMFNNFRVYGTVFVLIEFVICLIGIKLIQIVGPLSLACVVLAILSIFAGGITSRPYNSPMYFCLQSLHFKAKNAIQIISILGFAFLEKSCCSRQLTLTPMARYFATRMNQVYCGPNIVLITITLILYAILTLWNTKHAMFQVFQALEVVH